jgi:hypothetical protein
MNTTFALPKGVMSMLLDGFAPEGYEKTSDFVFNLGLDMSVYTELALGYSRKITSELMLGVKLKALFGSANVSIKNENLILTPGIDEWRMHGADSWNATLPAEQILNSENKIDPKPDKFGMSYFTAGMGGAIDLGATYAFRDFPLSLSLAVNDLGFIRWKGTQNIDYTTDFSFEGIPSKDLNFDDIGNVLDSIGNGFTNSFDYSLGSKKPYTRGLSAKILLGAEYSLLKDNLLSVGALYRNSGYFNETTAALSTRPVDWFNMALSYTFTDGFKTSQTFGIACGLRMAYFHFNFAADFVPLSLARVTAEIPPIVPYRQNAFNFRAGVSIVLGNPKNKKCPCRDYSHEQGSICDQRELACGNQQNER